MPTPTSQAMVSPSLDTKLLSYYLWAGVGLAAAAMIFALFNLPARYLYLATAAPLAFIIVVSPRLALYQFVFALFIEYPLVPSVPIYLIDISMGLVIVAGGLDFLLNGRWPTRLPRLSLNYLYICLALVTAGFFGFWPELMPRRVLSTGALLITFLAVYRLSSNVSVLALVRIFVGLAAAHSVLIMVPFLTSGGAFRSFGFHGVLFDDQAMVALPLAVAIYLASPKATAGWHLLAVLAIAGGLTATQSRAPIAMALIVVLFVIWWAMRCPQGTPIDQSAGQHARSRVKSLAVIGFALIGFTIMLQPHLFSTLGDRFGELLSSEPQGSTVYRLALWQRAISTFLDYPLFGVGPGGYYHLEEIYWNLHITPDYVYLKTLGAHNVLLHYLADAGLVGGLGLAALVINQFRVGWRGWRTIGLGQGGAGLALMGWVFLFALSTVIEASWMWGQLSFLAVFFAALVSRQYRQSVQGNTP